MHFCMLLLWGWLVEGEATSNKLLPLLAFMGGGGHFKNTGLISSHTIYAVTF